jgi:UDPglucose 6-dehydrogenase
MPRGRPLCLHRGCGRDADPHEWDQFRALDLDRIKAALRSPVVVDLRNLYQAC